MLNQPKYSGSATSGTDDKQRIPCPSTPDKVDRTFVLRIDQICFSAKLPDCTVKMVSNYPSGLKTKAKDTSSLCEPGGHPGKLTGAGPLSQC
jgi:hypothetical protein